jgi:hypothetical protein
MNINPPLLAAKTSAAIAVAAMLAACSGAASPSGGNAALVGNGSPAAALADRREAGRSGALAGATARPPSRRRERPRRGRLEAVEKILTGQLPCSLAAVADSASSVSVPPDAKKTPKLMRSHKR